jgi:hypothetical protein
MKTAVEWFMDKIAEKQPNGLYVIDTLEDVQNIFEEAKAIEKEQIKNDYAKGFVEGCSYMYDNDKKFIDKEDYYNQNYNLN